ncbi:unnamed protein product [Cuscuta epithymum]|uniref:Uncharacterized protein n=1 Tax=Cuscuta epithymum TaxID=186058 RepID=A0AAV0CI54_9ASTE|nr:unnamed protein product [Cuscuta epithymum]
MPPSPAMRRSPGRGRPKTENHNRGRSLENGVVFQEKVDDLALFNEVQSRERDNFLLDTKDEFEDLCSAKLRCFSEYKLGISIPARGESSELLNEEGDKNDYDWLLTPPDTPLFPSLDDETPPVNAQQRGRPRSQPISISRSATMEMSYRSSRGSASPNRLSSSPRSSNNNTANHQIMRRRPSSSPSRSSPPPTSRHATPPRRPTPHSPPHKLSTPPLNSSSPTPRRLSTGSRVRGTSPVKSNRGNSASPKIRAPQSNILHGFSLEAPPNLRTSLADRPTSYVRGSSPASGNGSSRRSSKSPARSASSTYSHDRVRSHSKCSIASSGDDDTESLQSIHVSSLDPLSHRSIGGALQQNKAMGLNKKTTRILSSSSAPKRSIDSTLRQMDQRKSPHNMFRPLLSSVPSSTFYSGKASAAQRSLGSLHSSVTTSSNASSDQGMGSVAHDTEDSEQNQVITSEHARSLYHDSEVVFTLDSVDTLDLVDIDKKNAVSTSCLLDKLDGDPPHVVDLVAQESLRVVEKEMTQLETLVVCSKCSKKYLPSIRSTEEDPKLCLDCKSSEAQQSLRSSSLNKLLVLNDSLEVSASNHEEEAYSYCENQSEVPGWDLTSNKSIDQTHQFNSNLTVSRSDSGGDSGYQQLRTISHSSSANVDVLPECAGISLLLKRSGSYKGHIVQNRTLSATSIAYDDLSYVRDSMSSMRSSFGHGSATASSSSVDFGSNQQIEIGTQRQSYGGRKLEMENYRHEIDTKLQRSISSTSSQALRPSSLATSSSLEEVGIIASQTEKDAEVTRVDPEEPYLGFVNAEADLLFSKDKSDSVCRISSNLTSIHADEAANFECNFSENDYILPNSDSSLNMDPSGMESVPSAVKEDVTNYCVDNLHQTEISEQDGADTKCGLEIQNDGVCSNHLQSDSSSVSSTHEGKECALHAATDSEIRSSFEVQDTCHKYEESTVVLEGRPGVKTRSLTLEEATDTILFCSSIVHNLAYNAADIAIGKENSCTPTLTIGGGKASPDRRNLRSRTAARRNSRSSSQQKVKPKVMEPETKPLPNNTDSDESTEKSNARIVGAPPSKVEAMKPPLKLESKCNCTVM